MKSTGLTFYPKIKSTLQKEQFWSPAFQTSNKTPNTGYKNRNHTDKSASITTSTSRGAGLCCLHNCSLPVYPKQCWSHALQNSSRRRKERSEGAYRCRRLQPSILAPLLQAEQVSMKGFQLLQMYFPSLWVYESLQWRDVSLWEFTM